MDEALPADALVGVETVDWFATFYRSHRLAMIRLAFMLVDDREVAEDIVQTAFAKVFQKQARIETPLPYLRSCVYNGCRNHHRWVRVQVSW
jgi:DNA-directed RNA polymerase specialized sigma24 family protein